MVGRIFRGTIAFQVEASKRGVSLKNVRADNIGVRSDGTIVANDLGGAEVATHKKVKESITYSIQQLTKLLPPKTVTTMDTAVVKDWQTTSPVPPEKILQAFSQISVDFSQCEESDVCPRGEYLSGGYMTPPALKNRYYSPPASDQSADRRFSPQPPTG